VTAAWSRRTLVLLGALVALSPAFVWAGGVVGYAEPMGNLAAQFGVESHVSRAVPALLPEYRVAGVGPYAGTLLSAAAGVAVTFAAAMGVGHLLSDPSGR
jgi:hypothetical protein